MSIADYGVSQRISRRAVPMAAIDLTQSADMRAICRPKVRRGEIVRKAIHMFPGALPFALALYPHSRTLPWRSLEILAVLTAVLTVVYILAKRVVSRPGETNFYSTCLSYPATILATLFAFRHHPEFACVVVVVLAFGDGSAYIGGNLLGRRKLPWNADKTWAGTLSFIAIGAPLATLAYWMEANATSLAYGSTGGPAMVPLGMAALCGGVATVTASIAESLPTELTDNLRVGVAASAAVIAAHYLSAGWFPS